MHDTELGLKKDGSFRFHIPFDLEKSRDGKINIEGIASIQSPDISGETVIQKGMDLSYFLKRGFFNDNHAKDSGGKVGVPTYAKHTTNGLHVKGYLLDTPRAQGIVELADSLSKAGNDRQLGFSVEGKVKRRNGKLIEKSWIKDIAITAEPVHPDTYMNICKSLSAEIEEAGTTGSEQGIGAKIGDILSHDQVDALKTLCKSLPDQDAPDEDTEKSLEAGHQVPPRDNGSALRKQDLESDLKNQDIPQKTKEEDDEEIDSDLKAHRKLLNKSQAVDIVLARGYSETAAKRMVDLLFDNRFSTFITDTQN